MFVFVFYSCTYVLIRRWINGWDVAFSLGFSSFAQTVITQSSVISHMAASKRAFRLCALKGRSVVIQEQALIDCTHWPESGLKTLSGFRADAANTFKQFLSFRAKHLRSRWGYAHSNLTLLIWLLWKGECQDIYVIMRYCSGLKLARISRLWAALNFKAAARPIELFLKAAHSFS